MSEGLILKVMSLFFSGGMVYGIIRARKDEEVDSKVIQVLIGSMLGLCAFIFFLSACGVVWAIYSFIKYI